MTVWTVLAALILLYVAAWLVVIAPYIATLHYGGVRWKHLPSCIRSYFRALLRPRSWRASRDYGQRNLRFYRMVHQQAKQAYADWQMEKAGNP